MDSNVTMLYDQSQPHNGRNFSIERYKALSINDIIGYPNVILPSIKNEISIFSGLNNESIDRQHQQFSDLMDGYGLDHEDVITRLFMESLKDVAMEWFSELIPCSISLWQEFLSIFIEIFGEKHVSSMLVDFMNIYIEENKLVLEFNVRLVNTLKRLPKEIRPHDAMIFCIYLGAFDRRMSYRLRSGNP